MGVPAGQERYTRFTRLAHFIRSGRGGEAQHTAARLSSDAVGTPQTAPTGSALVRDLVLYTVARLAIVAITAFLLVLAGVPLLVSVLLALVVAVPVSMLLFGALRARVNAGLAAHAARRRAERDRLRQQLRGDS